MPNPSDACPCGSGKTFGECCGPLLAGQRQAATAEELMRARFTAHATRAFEFVHRTFRGTAHQPYEPERGANLPDVEWTKLEIHTHAPGATPDLATVDFSAHGRQQGAAFVHHEKAEFAWEGATWIYTRPLREGPEPVRHAGPKVGRNDPCPCGSGKKFKHCCGR